VLDGLDATEDGRFALRFERQYRCPRARIWQAIAEPDQLRQWFDQMIDYDSSQLDFVEGGSLLFIAKDAQLFPALPGRVIRLDAPRLLEYTKGSLQLQWQLEATPDDQCLLTLAVLVELRSIAFAEAPTWQTALDSLRRLIT
jgi:uncharacterized protein YndB with AHSA1/START domain